MNFLQSSALRWCFWALVVFVGKYKDEKIFRPSWHIENIYLQCEPSTFPWMERKREHKVENADNKNQEKIQTHCLTIINCHSSVQYVLLHISLSMISCPCVQWKHPHMAYMLSMIFTQIMATASHSSYFRSTRSFTTAWNAEWYVRFFWPEHHHHLKWQWFCFLPTFQNYLLSWLQFLSLSSLSENDCWFYCMTLSCSRQLESYVHSIFRPKYFIQIFAFWRKGKQNYLAIYHASQSKCLAGHNSWS